MKTPPHPLPPPPKKNKNKNTHTHTHTTKHNTTQSTKKMIYILRQSCKSLVSDGGKTIYVKR
jgi:hypothetical protein